MEIPRMSAVTTPDVNYWYDKRCAKAFSDQGHIGPYRQLLAHTTEWLDPMPGENWVDLGCGIGRLTRALWDKCEGRLGSIVSLDCAAANVDAIARIRESYDPPISDFRMRFVHADFSNGLGTFESNTIDGVVSGLAIQYAQHWSEKKHCWTTDAYDQLLRDVRRILRPSGRFVFSVNVPNPSWLKVGLLSVPSAFTARKPLRFLKNSLRMMRYGRWLKQESAKGRFHYLQAETIGKKLVEAGFIGVEHRVSFTGQAFIFRSRKP